METLLETAEIKIQDKHCRENQVHSIEDVFDHIDGKFIKFYGEYGRKIVNERRTEFNQDGTVNLKML
jgi:hypothetical protein